MLIKELLSHSHSQGTRGYLCPYWHLPLLLFLFSILFSTNCAGHGISGSSPWHCVGKLVSSLGLSAVAAWHCLVAVGSSAPEELG